MAVVVHFPDISGYQAGMSLADLAAVAVKATEGAGYTNPDYGRVVREARTRNILQVAYHFLRRGTRASPAAAQAVHALSVIGAGVPTMLDVEPPNDGTPGPTLTDVYEFVDPYRAGGGLLHLVYLPRWYWRDLGSPDLTGLTARQLHLVSSAYPTAGYSDDGPGWGPYGGVAPAVWQWTDKAPVNGRRVDMNAYRGDLAALRGLVTAGGAMTLDQEERNLLETAGGAVVHGGTSMGPPVPPERRIHDDPTLTPDASGRYGNSEIDLLQYIRWLLEHGAAINSVADPAAVGAVLLAGLDYGRLAGAIVTRLAGGGTPVTAGQLADAFAAAADRLHIQSAGQPAGPAALPPAGV